MVERGDGLKKATTKKAVLVVSIGTAYPEARQLVIKGVQDTILPDFPDYVVRRAFTSSTLIAKLAELDGIKVDNEKQALQRLAEEGFTEVVVQPFHIETGEEYERVQDVVQYYAERKAFGKIVTAPCLTVWVKPIPSSTQT